MKWIKNNNNHDSLDKENSKNMSIKTRVNNRIAHVRRKVSRGAANIFRVMKDHCHWGNKQLWGNREHGRSNMPTDKSNKHKH